ncbi:MAG: sulfide/dihydroorotate dehydrogenase-like FAD/NAD-binding protein [Nitrospirota bacterium]
MATIIDKATLSPKTSLFIIDAPHIARKHLPGQFVIVRKDGMGERIPLTIADSDPVKGTITIICQEAGRTSKEIQSMVRGDSFLDIVGPLGRPTHLDRFGTVILVAGGYGVATINPIAKGLKRLGNKIVVIIGARTKEFVIWEDQIRMVSDEVYVTTDNGSYGRKGLVLDELKRIVIDDALRPGLVVTVGPIPMMKAVCAFTASLGIPTYTSLNSIMLDGTGMCGSCRVTIGGEVKFVCVDGPEFDGHKVDFDELSRRNRIYLEEEKIAHKKCYEVGLGEA